MQTGRIAPRPRTRAIARKAWSKNLEADSLRRDKEKEAAGLAAFSALDLPTQMRAAQEIVETRSAELTLAFENVVMVGAGYKRIGSSRRNSRWNRSPCVLLVVRHKWQPGTHLASAQRLPHCLMTYVQRGNKRVLVSVPTDVIPEVEFYGHRAQSGGPSGLAVPGRVGEKGNACCAVRLSADGANTLLLMSCHHVLSPDRALGTPAPDAGAPVLNLATRQPIGSALPFGGYLNDLQGLTSFDVQFAEVHDTVQLAAAVRGLELSGMTHIDDERVFRTLPPSTPFRIMCSPTVNPQAQQGPLYAQFQTYLYNAAILQYWFWDGSDRVSRVLTFPELLVFALRPGSSTIPGDSGSAVVCPGPDGRMTIVGMHIGGGVRQGSPLAYSFVLPAWQLFDPASYGLPQSATIKPV